MSRWQRGVRSYFLLLLSALLSHITLIVSLREESEEAMHQDTDSDVPERGDGGKVKVKWTQEEDDKLKALVQKMGTNDWKHIANYIPNHSEPQCQHRWFKVLDPELVKGRGPKRKTRRL
ncbi:hypothetical protein KUCAC02_029900 [Chaenocephalus aceratus]|uniref:Uncharacterized protein n=1 Tax=Chaenocephalus aceratus TaxID=36190 RepID=A0ACB9XJD1_CHAAC|nr:hypothetical protein KUCAC02_029900 [Chaenocephalus aceratus]